MRTRDLPRKKPGRATIGWTPDQLAMLGTGPDLRVARYLGVHPATVAKRRKQLGIPRVDNRHVWRWNWTREQLAMLGTVPDEKISAKTGLSTFTIAKKRCSLGISAWRNPQFDWTASTIRDLASMTIGQFCKKFRVKPYMVIRKRNELHIRTQRRKGVRANFSSKMIAMLGKRSDQKLALIFQLGVKVVRCKRHELGIRSYRSGLSKWTEQYLNLLGKMNDRELAEIMKISLGAVTKRRTKLGIKAFFQPFEWTQSRLTLLGKISDADAGKKLGLTARQVKQYRKKMKIRAYRNTRISWTDEKLRLIGTMSDRKLAVKLGTTLLAVRAQKWGLRRKQLLRSN